MNKYKGFDKNRTKEDLNEKELDSYNKLMEGIGNASKKEKDEVSYLMEVFLETEEKVYAKCARCGKDFENNFKNVTQENKRIYCNECLKKMWG